jgi:hydrogenase maturation protease
MRILIYGIGNPGRQDDALGPGLVEAMQRAFETTAGIPAVVHEFSFDANYQLNVEDAEALSRHDVVVFADASRTDQSFRLTAIDPEPTASFSTHSVSPGGIVALCNQLYDAHPAVYMLAIRGYEWEVNEALSDHAQTNLEAAAAFLIDALRSGDGEATDDDAHSLLGRFVS